ncbi:MAG TPA: serine/threonine-protein kinase [Rubricoccaceae bacterium]|nr:serine/threonine-protein kinase [Rubricoccaceae bacterium]
METARSEAARWARLNDLLLDALEQPAAGRDAFLDAACVDETGAPDPALRAEVAALLAAHEAAERDDAFTSPFALREAAGLDGARVGAWRLVEPVGAGGMGEVWRAERADGAYRQTAALKLLRPGLGPDFRARFLHERQLLAGLRHPGIARLLDGGEADGRPFLAVEFVDGEPITAYADARDLDVEARLRLFLQVCDAVAYAHRHLVVHRDLKPSNVLVAEEEGEPVVKLLDFGIAKLLAEGEGSEVPLTRTGLRVMTPEYAAPEQVTGGAVTTATDVYALGVLLYELLAGRRPYDLSGKTASEVERVVCEETPARPSTVAAVAPGAAPAAPRRRLRGDLDTVVMKALEKEPERRYPSAETLADDLRRHLGGLPVQARPATAGYRVGRFVRRHRLGVAAAAAVAMALVGGAAVALGQARVARAETAKAEAVNAFLIGLLGAANPDEDGRDVRVASLLDRAAADLGDAFEGQPDLEAAARHTLGVTYRELGLYAEAETQLGRALALRERLHGPRHPDVAETQHALALTRHEQGDYAAADSLYTLALATNRARFGQRHARTSLVLNDLGLVRYETGDLDGAIALYRQSLAIDEAMLGPDDRAVLQSLGNLAVALADKGETDEAARLFERTLATYRSEYPDDDESIAHALANLGSVRYDQGRGEEAAALQAEAVERFRRALGERHDYVAFALSNLGSTLGSLGRHAEAEPILREAASIYEEALGETHPNVGFPLVNLAKTLRELGQLEEAEAAARRAITLFREGFGPEHFAVGRALAALGDILMDGGRPADAAFRDALAVQEATLPPDHPDIAGSRSALGAALAALGRPDEAGPLLASGYEALRTSLGPDHARTRQAHERLLAFQQAAGR